MPEPKTQDPRVVVINTDKMPVRISAVDPVKIDIPAKETPIPTQEVTRTYRHELLTEDCGTARSSVTLAQQKDAYKKLVESINGKVHAEVVAVGYQTGAPADTDKPNAFWWALLKVTS